MTQLQLSHPSHIPYKTTGAVTEEGGAHSEEGEEQGWPGGDVAGEQVVHVDSALRSKKKVNKEEEDKDDEAEKGLVGEHRRPEGNKAAGDHLKVTKQGGHPCDDQEEKKEACPEPAKADRGEGSLDDGHGDQPDVLPRHRDDGHVALCRGGDAVEVDRLPRVGNTQESQGEEAGENEPDKVAGDEDAAVADQVVLQLVVAGKGGEGTQAKLEGEDHLSHSLHPDAGLSHDVPVGSHQGGDAQGAAALHAGADGQGHQEHEGGWDCESADLAKSSSASHSKNKGGDSGDGEHEGQLTS